MKPLSKSSRIFVAGHRGMVGSAIVSRLRDAGYPSPVVRTRAELDLTDSAAVRRFFEAEAIDAVVLAAAKVGGIHANNEYPADFLRDNLSIELNVIDSAYQAGVTNLLFLGSSCIYPRLATQPIVEEALLSGPLEPTNEPYAIAKIAGIKLCESYNRQYGVDFRSVMPTNLYGPGDNFHPENSHVIPGLMRRFHEAVVMDRSSVTIWGTGVARREFLHVNDLATGCVHFMEQDREKIEASTSPMMSHINIGTGVDCSIKELATIIAGVTGFTGEIEWDTSKPDGTPRKLLDASLAKRLGWVANIGLEDGLSSTYDWFVRQQKLGESLRFD